MTKKAWNKGLTKDDPRVAKYLEKTQENWFKPGIIPWNKGKKGVQQAWNKGIPRTDEEKHNISLAKKGKPNPKLQGELNPHYKPDRNIGYRQRHREMEKRLGVKPETCSHCGINPGFTKDGKNKIQWANISGEYRLEESDWIALCISCHKKFDKIVRNFKGKKPWSRQSKQNSSQ